MIFEPIFRCKCKKSKTNRMILDGGTKGNYTIELCSTCYNNHNKKFLISEEIISKSNISLSQNQNQVIL
ncbi:hypothetical protein NADRNF5_2070 [Nitrosopumilus adriaticus]|uniref:Uncharacterized protein n=1 Tax=Nitrosopumilus adriaticus TaxID=1580092 RepID=A0A0D5C4J9_9ARCH|nr:hypothetical protein NADRNF5_2070 [Nitrosopumilus adriaticus]